jgi:hypothetical protein
MKTEKITAPQGATLTPVSERAAAQRSQQGAGSSTISSCSPLSPLKAIANFFSWLFDLIFCRKKSPLPPLPPLGSGIAQISQNELEEHFAGSTSPLVPFILGDPAYVYSEEHFAEVKLGSAKLHPGTHHYGYLENIYPQEFAYFIEITKQRSATAALPILALGIAEFKKLFDAIPIRPDLNLKAMTRELLIYRHTGCFPIK